MPKRLAAKTCPGERPVQSNADGDGLSNMERAHAHIDIYGLSPSSIVEQPFYALLEQPKFRLDKFQDDHTLMYTHTHLATACGVSF